MRTKDTKVLAEGGGDTFFNEYYFKYLLFTKKYKSFCLNLLYRPQDTLDYFIIIINFESKIAWENSLLGIIKVYKNTNK